MRRAAYLAAALLVVAGAWLLWPSSSAPGPGACEVVTSADLAAAVGHAVGRGEQSAADGSRRDATVCNYREATVFTLRRGAAAFFRDQHDGPGEPVDLAVEGGQAFTEPTSMSDGDRVVPIVSLWVLHDGQYVNARLFEPSPGAAERLARRLLAQ